jgi:hypothetical protein
MQQLYYMLRQAWYYKEVVKALNDKYKDQNRWKRDKSRRKKIILLILKKSLHFYLRNEGFFILISNFVF